jgi:hypothetical protein
MALSLKKILMVGLFVSIETGQIMTHNNRNVYRRSSSTYALAKGGMKGMSMHASHFSAGRIGQAQDLY